MRKLLLLALMLAGALPAAAQFTIVTGTVKDVNGIPYAGGTISASLVVPGGASPTLNGVSFTGSMSPIGLDSTGSFTARLADNNVVLPSGTQWKFLVNIQNLNPPIGTGPQTCTATLTITGASQSVSASFSACPALSNAGGGGITSVATPNSGLSGPQQLFPNAPPYNINFDAHSCMGTHVSFPSGATPTITIDANCQPFTVGQTLKGFVTNCYNPLACYGGVGGQTIIPMSTVTPITTTTATMSGTASAASNGFNTFWYGTDQRAAWATLDAAFSATKGCADIRLPAGGSFIPLKIFNTLQTVCGLVTVGSNESSALIAGNTIHGAGVSATRLIIPPDEVMNCTTQPVANTCMMAAIMGGGDFTITGGGNCQTNFPALQTIWGPPSVSASTWWQNVTFTNFACTDANNPVGVSLGFSNKFDGIYSDAFGARNLIGVGGNNIACFHCYFGETLNQPLAVQGSSTARLFDTYIGSTQSTIGLDCGGNLTLEASQNYGGVATGGTQIFVRTGCVLTLDKWYENTGAAFDVELQAGGIAHIRNSRFTATTHNWGTNGVALTTGAIFDEGGNTFSSNNNESTVLPTCAMTTGGGTGPACVTANTVGNAAFDVVMTPGTTPGSSGTTTITYAGTNQINSGLLPTLTCTLKNGTGTWNARATLILSTDSATVPVLTWDNNAVALTAASTYIFKCTSKAN